MRPRLSDRYIFGELFVPFLIGTLAVLMMLVGNTLFEMLNQIMREKLPLGEVVRILLLNIPTVLVMTLPVSTALAASLATNRMARDNEITVLRGAGVPLFRIFLPILVFGILTSIAGIFLNDRVVPWAFREQQDIQGYLDRLPSNPVDAGLTIPVDHYVVTFSSAQKISEKRRRLNGVVIVDKGAKPGDFPLVTTARSADYEDGVWYLKDVVHHQYDQDGMTVLDAHAPTGTWPMRIDFSQAYSSLAADQADKSMSFAELTQLAQASRRQGQLRAAAEYEVARWFKLSLPMMSVVLALCGPPLALRFARTGAFTGVLLSIITVFVAWNTLLFMKAVGIGQYLPAPVAAWSTNALFTVLGLWLLRTQE